MAIKRTQQRKRARGNRNARRARGTPRNVSRAELDAALSRWSDEHAKRLNALRIEVHATCRELAADVERILLQLQTQFTRIAQLQQEIEAIRKRQSSA
jgi:hypothetical protein